jgi:hypothetical protein
MEMHGGGAPKLIYGCGRSPEGLRFKLEIKWSFIPKFKILRCDKSLFIVVAGESCVKGIERSSSIRGS